jgi:hypothetical protein
MRGSRHKIDRSWVPSVVMPTRGSDNATVLLQLVTAAYGTKRHFVATHQFGRYRIKADIRAAIHCRCPVSFTVRHPLRMILDPRLGAHVLFFELSDERSETRRER